MLSVLLLALVLECTHPQAGVLSGCEKFLCQLFNSAWVYISQGTEMAHVQAAEGYNQGVEKLLPTQGCITEHILLRAHAPTSQHMVARLSMARPIILDPVTLGWRQLEDGH